MLDGADAGVSPTTLQDIAAGNHTLTAIKEGYAMTEQPVRIIVGQTVRAEIVLEPQAVPTAAQRAGFPIPPEIPVVIIFFLIAVHYRSGSV
jgi:hypothetical protein